MIEEFVTYMGDEQQGAAVVEEPPLRGSMPAALSPTGSTKLQRYRSLTGVPGMTSFTISNRSTIVAVVIPHWAF